MACFLIVSLQIKEIKGLKLIPSIDLELEPAHGNSQYAVQRDVNVSD